MIETNINDDTVKKIEAVNPTPTFKCLNDDSLAHVDDEMEF